jgi:hypothetical protein
VPPGSAWGAGVNGDRSHFIEMLEEKGEHRQIEILLPEHQKEQPPTSKPV